MIEISCQVKQDKYAGPGAMDWIKSHVLTTSQFKIIHKNKNLFLLTRQSWKDGSNIQMSQFTTIHKKKKKLQWELARSRIMH